MPRLPALLLALTLLLTACQPTSPPRLWAVADLRLLDPAEGIPASTDLLAVYTRTVGSDLEIRLDLLDLPLIPDYNLSLTITTLTDEITVRLPADGGPSATGGTSSLRPRLVRDPYLDTVTVRFNRLSIPGPFTLQAFSYLPGNSTPVDETAPVRSDALPPTQRAPVLLAFWDVFPATTPAQALRRWDGAHTGPSGGRHGLSHILAAAAAYRVPVALLDVKTPASLAALDFMDKIPYLRQLAEDGLLLLPDSASSEPADVALAYSRLSADGFGLPASPFVYAAAGTLQPSYLAQFLALPDAAHLAVDGGTRLLPLPAADEIQATADGLALDVRRALMATALSADESDLVTLGGSLPSSTWGAYDNASPSFAWLAGHPWIRVLDKYDLLTFPAGTKFFLPAPAAETSPWLDALAFAPVNALSDSAWQTYLCLTAPTPDTNLAALRTAYLGQVGTLLAAADWAESPSTLAGCDFDPDRDGAVECILANATVFAVFETDGARLTHLVTLDENGPHQLVAPMAQFTAGLSDPREWRPTLGDDADPGLLMGLSDVTRPYEAYTVNVQADTLVFTNADGSRVKTYRLGETGLEMTVQADGPIEVRIPLTADPAAFYAGPVTYLARLRPRSWSWGLDNGIRVEVRTDAALTAQGFTASLPFLSLPENPDQQFPRGHFYPFPLSVVTLQADESLGVWIGVK